MPPWWYPDPHFSNSCLRHMLPTSLWVETFQNWCPSLWSSGSVILIYANKGMERATGFCFSILHFIFMERVNDSRWNCKMSCLSPNWWNMIFNFFSGFNFSLFFVQFLYVFIVAICIQLVCLFTIRNVHVLIFLERLLVTPLKISYFGRLKYYMIFKMSWFAFASYTIAQRH